MIIAGETNVMLKLKSKHTKYISTLLKRAAIEHGSSVDPSDYVQNVGEVVSLPRRISKNSSWLQGFTTKDIQVGDTAIIRYDVVLDMIDQSDKEDNEPIYRNRIWYKGEEYFAASIEKIFGVIRNGEIKMINGYVMTSDFVMPKLIIPIHMTAEAKGATKAEVIAIGSPKEGEKPIKVKQGDTVYFNPDIAQHYKFQTATGQKNFCILTQDKILGKQV